MLSTTYGTTTRPTRMRITGHDLSGYLVPGARARARLDEKYGLSREILFMKAYSER
jgi:hypothetical protein